MPLFKISNCENCGVDHEWIFDTPKLKELRDIKKLTGMNGNAFMEASDEGDPDALAALIYVLHKRDKIHVNFDDVDLDFNNLDIVETPEEKAEREKAEKEAERQAKAEGKKSGGPKSGQTSAGD